MSKLLLLLLFLNMLYGESEYTITIEKSVEETPFTKNDVIKMARLGITVALDGEGYQAEENVTKSMNPKDLINAKLLNLKGINLQVIPSWLFRFHNLRYLNLSNTNIDIYEVEKLLSENAFKKLDVLILSDNSLFKDTNESFNNVIDKLESLNSIDLSNTGGKASNYMGLSKIKSLQEINLGHNKIDSIELLDFNQLTNLQILDLSFNSLEKINLKLLPKYITSIDLSNNNLKELQVSTFQYLEELNLKNNFLLKANKKLCGEFVLPHISVIKGSDMCKKVKDYNYVIRVGLFSKKENAIKISNALLKKGFPIFSTRKIINSKLYHSVKIGFYENEKEAKKIQKTLPKKYRKDFKIYGTNEQQGKGYVVRFGLFSKVNSKIIKIRNTLLRKKFSAFIIKRKIDNKYFYSLEVGFFLNINIAKKKKQEIITQFPRDYFEEVPLVRKI